MPTTRWPLPRLLILILAFAFLGLLSDIRIEHVEAVHDEPLAWTPILYSALMALACLLYAFLWNQILRRILLPLFLAAFIVGGLGFYLHNSGHFSKVAQATTRAWLDPQMKHPKGPPQTAPLAFAGLGLLGALASLKRFH